MDRIILIQHIFIYDSQERDLWIDGGRSKKHKEEEKADNIVRGIKENGYIWTVMIIMFHRLFVST